MKGAGLRVQVRDTFYAVGRRPGACASGRLAHADDL